MFTRSKPRETTTGVPMRAVGIESKALVPTRVAQRPTAKPGEVLIKVAYAGVNHADLLQVAGNYPAPEGASTLPGLEVSGTIEAIGEGVIGWSIGEQVCALLPGGGYAEYATAPAGQVLALPSRVSLKEAASLPEAAATAMMALSAEAGIQPYERLLLHGGTSGVGLLMGQIARAWGCPVYATVGGAEKVSFLETFGIYGIDHTASGWAEQVKQLTVTHPSPLGDRNEAGVDVIVDILGATEVQAHFNLLRRGGRLVSLAFLDGNVVESLKVARLLTQNLRWSGAMLRSRSTEQKAALAEQVRKRVWPHLATGRVRPVIDSVFPLEAAEKAHQRMQERLHMGKILLEVAPE